MKRKYIMTCLIFLDFYNVFGLLQYVFLPCCFIKNGENSMFFNAKRKKRNNGNTDRTQNKQAHSTIYKNRHL